MISLLLLNHFYPVASHRRVQKKKQRRIIVYGSVTPLQSAVASDQIVRPLHVTTRQKIMNVTYCLYPVVFVHERCFEPGKWPRALVITRRKVESRGSATSESEVGEVLSNMFPSRSNEIYLLSESRFRRLSLSK